MNRIRKKPLSPQARVVVVYADGSAKHQLAKDAWANSNRCVVARWPGAPPPNSE